MTRRPAVWRELDAAAAQAVEHWREAVGNVPHPAHCATTVGEPCDCARTCIACGAQVGPYQSEVCPHE